MEIIRRPMNPDEYELVRRRAGLDESPGAKKRARFRTPWLPQALIAAFALWLAPIFAINVVLPPRDLVVPLGCGSLFVLFGASAWFFRRRVRRADLAHDVAQRARYAADLEARQIEEYSVRIVRAVSVEAFEDEGMQFFLEIEDGRVVFLGSQEFYDDERYESGFPSELTVTRLPLNGEMLGFQTSGPFVPLAEEWPPLSAEDDPNARGPGAGAILPGPLSRYRTTRVED
jgi:hypothetical protein